VVGKQRAKWHRRALIKEDPHLGNF
jgi:hypothetical protein